MKKHRITSSREAVPAKGQHTMPCIDCPWERSAIPGWLGGGSVEEWLECAHSDELVDCHALTGAQCAGIAIYRANVAKVPRTAAVLRLPANPKTVFAIPDEFRSHHERKLK